MAAYTPLKEYFGPNLAALLSEKIAAAWPGFDSQGYTTQVEAGYEGLELKDRVDLHARALKAFLPEDYEEALQILLQIMGPVNPRETGMFIDFYWLMPVGKYIESYGLGHFEASMQAIGELTQRNTGEYTIRPYIRQNPEQVLEWMQRWSLDPSFHLRRLASEGLRPKLPWAPKLDLFVARYEPVFAIFENLREDPSRFVQKSVANHLNDYLKLNPAPALQLLARWSESAHPHTRWIVRHASRRLPRD